MKTIEQFVEENGNITQKPNGVITAIIINRDDYLKIQNDARNATLDEAVKAIDLGSCNGSTVREKILTLKN